MASNRAGPARDQIRDLLAGINGEGTFAARRTARADDLHLEVHGIGRIRFPISSAQARRLARATRPARYGRGAQTLLDKRVRDTGKIPKSRVKIDRRRWNRTLLPVLAQLRQDLGLRHGHQLKAELHSMLVYEPGQFFLPHQDSEKSDGMVGTLVVTLPSSFKGGALVIEHMGKKVTYRTSTQPLSFVAFYADCKHEVRPVTEGCRVVLTYNLMLVPNRRTRTTDEGTAIDSPVVATLAERLREHFETPLPPRWETDDSARVRQPRSRFVYLLDHQYTERGLGWDRLKGDDAARAAALRAASEQADCEIVLALANVHETWGCDEDWDPPWYTRGRRWERDEDDDWISDDEPAADDPDRYTLIDLHDWSITLRHMVDSSGKKARAISTEVRDEEVCTTTPTVDLEPYASEYEGYMGNYGNTMDRWYRRAAIVLWPRENAFAMRAEASPADALEALKKRIRAGSAVEARALAATLLPFWDAVAAREERRGFIDKALFVANGLDDPELARALLNPLPLSTLTPRRAPAFATLVQRYGEDWARRQLAAWAVASVGSVLDHRGDRVAWTATLPQLCAALCASAAESGSAAARLLLENEWNWLTQMLVQARAFEAPSHRDSALADLALPILALLQGTAIAGADDLGVAAVSFLCDAVNEPVLSCLVAVVRAASETVTGDEPAPTGIGALRAHCVGALEERLATPARSDGDWSILLPRDCGCGLCDRLAAFLAAPDQRRVVWPLAKERRRHLHVMLDLHELPVRHETRRSGSPYTLILTKMDALFDQEAAARGSWQADLDWLRAWVPPAPAPATTSPRRSSQARRSRRGLK
jgi:predicted 2-oxoglutarate/Fe(II)-dependent dioxygenase YbiX